MAIERVCVIGAGVIGSLYAAHLARTHEVSVLTRRAGHAEALNAEGLRVSGKTDFTARLFATADAAALPECDLGIVATKATQLEEAAAALASRFTGATLMTIQTGSAPRRSSACTATGRRSPRSPSWPGVRHADSHVEYELDTETWLGPYARTTTYERAQEIEVLLVNAGLRARSFPDLRPAQWSKLIFNATVNMVAALTDLPHVDQFARRDEQTDLGHLVHELMAEGKRVAAAAGVELYEDPWEMNVEAVRRGETAAAHGAYAHVPSMLEEVRARRGTEGDFITGALVREAGRLGVPAPLHTTMYRLVKARESAYS